jgi:hypothetical protein
VSVTRRGTGEVKPREVRLMSRGAHFGEKALLR